MKYISIEQALKEIFKLDGFNQYFDVSADYDDFEDTFGLSNESICISYNGMDSTSPMESWDISVNENITVFIKYYGDFNDFRTLIKGLINDSKLSFQISDEDYVVHFENASIVKNDYLIGILNYSITGIW
jgi:hypothetical protein